MHSTQSGRCKEAAIHQHTWRWRRLSGCSSEVSTLAFSNSAPAHGYASISVMLGKYCRKVQERFAWLDEKNARDIEDRSSRHPVTYQALQHKSTIISSHVIFSQGPLNVAVQVCSHVSRNMMTGQSGSRQKSSRRCQASPYARRVCCKAKDQVCLEAKLCMSSWTEEYPRTQQLV